MGQKNSVSVPIVSEGSDKWLLLNVLGNSGKLRAGYISKQRSVLEKDGHHIREVSVRTSIKYYPKKYVF